MKNTTNVFEKIAQQSCAFTGSTPAFIGSFMLIVVWLVSGPFFNFSNTWQLVINTGTTIVTFLMVFLIQRAQNKDSKAMHLKLNELVASMKGSSNRLIDVEDSTEAELEILAKYYAELAKLAKKDKDVAQSHSIEEARDLHEEKEDEEEEEDRQAEAREGNKPEPGLQL